MERLMDETNPWRSYEIDPPHISSAETEIELHRLGPVSPWDTPQRYRYCDIPRWLNVVGLSWRPINPEIMPRARAELAEARAEIAKLRNEPGGDAPGPQKPEATTYATCRSELSGNCAPPPEDAMEAAMASMICQGMGAACADSMRDCTCKRCARAITAARSAERQKYAALIETTIRGTPYLDHYRQWLWYGEGNQADDSDHVQFCDALADHILDILASLGGQR